MPRRIYALMVGIDDYAPPLPRLRGCDHDLRALGQCLSRDASRDPNVKLELTVLRDAEARRLTVIDAFRSHLGQAKEEDAVLFYFSGHGSQQQLPEALGMLAPDHLDKSLVLVDSRREGTWDLTYLELARLIDEVASKGPFVTVILDCGHFDSGLRVEGLEGNVRYAPMDLRRRPMDSYLATSDEIKQTVAIRQVRSVSLPLLGGHEERLVVFTACRENQEAREFVIDGKTHGAFSFFLAESLQNGTEDWRNRNLLDHIAVAISGVLNDQTPQLEAVHAEDLDARFLDGTRQQPAAILTTRGLEPRATDHDELARGISARIGTHPVRLALSPFDASAVTTASRSLDEKSITLGAHPALTAEVKLLTPPVASRDLGRVLLPRLFYDDPNVCQPLGFSAVRGIGAGASVLELSQVNDPTLVSSTDPLRITLPIGVHANEHVIPFAHDGEFFLPLGYVENRDVDETSIVLERLPGPLVGTRSLGGAIKIFFQKAISKTLGLEFGYPVLAVTEVAADGTLNITRGAGEVRKRIAKAGKILLFVHGIIGETSTMVPSVQLARLPDGRSLASLYDVILTFDYENLGTTIEENGRLLKAKLAEVGLSAGHSRVLDIAAHSMGGLVSRWFLEREGGNQVVRKLVMLGTPNGGSPWPRIADWATMALSFGLNQLTEIPWPSVAVGWLAKWMENPKTTLNQMIAGSEFLEELNRSQDPDVPYVMIAGNTSLIPAATEGQQSVFSRLVSRVTSPQFLYEIADPFFLGQTNDIAATVASMNAVAVGWDHPMKVLPVACDHLNYFRDPAGLAALTGALLEESSL